MTRRYVRRKLDPEDPNAPGFEEQDARPDALSIDDMLEDSILILSREIKNLRQESSLGLLSRDSSNALTGYIKLLKELKREEKELLDNLSDEELEKLVDKDDEDL